MFKSRSSSEVMEKPKISEEFQLEVELESKTVDKKIDKDQDLLEQEIEDQNEASSGDNPDNDYSLCRDRERKKIKPPQRFGYADMIAYALNAASMVTDEEPRSYEEAMESKDHEKWQHAMVEGMKSLYKNQTWKLVEKPNGVKLVGSKWIFKRKEGIPGSEPPRYKARLVTKGFTRREGVDFNEIFSPAVKHCSIRVLLAMVAQFDMYLELMDIKTAFLNGELEEKIFMKQPEGFVVKNKESWVCLLQKSLYGLKLSPRQWYKCFDSFILSIKYKRSNFDSCVYYKKLDNSNYIYLLLY